MRSTHLFQNEDPDLFLEKGLKGVLEEWEMTMRMHAAVLSKERPLNTYNTSGTKTTKKFPPARVFKYCARC